ncbi:MAG: hypothetical protein F7B18_07880 [Desulfurococcales archaeon]|nr:hypothetical protein [Desulfurococcales archaeon]
MLLRGVVGGVFRVAAGIYLLYISHVIPRLGELLAQARGGVEAAGGLEDLASGLWRAASSGIDLLAGGLPGILLAILLWVLGGVLLNSGWGRLSRLWPGWVRAAFRILDIILGVVLIIGLLYPLRILYLIASNAGIEEILPSARLLILLYIAPLTLPILKALATLYYSQGGRWSRAGILLLALGGAIYLYTMYLVYTAFNPIHAIIVHINTMPAQPGLEQARQIALAGIDALTILLERTRTIIQALTIASILYTIGFLLIREDLSLRSGIRNILRIRKPRP